MPLQPIRSIMAWQAEQPFPSRALDTFGNPLTSIQYIRFTGGGGTGTYNINAVSRVGFTSKVTSVPEPDAAAIFAIGALEISVLCRRNRKQR